MRHCIAIAICAMAIGTHQVYAQPGLARPVPLRLEAGRPANDRHTSAEKLRFSQLTKEEGLTSNSVTAFAQDARGFIWIATSDGLNRYDGYAVTTHRSVQSDSTSLSSNSITALCPDDRGGMWVGTIGGGLNHYIARTGRFKRIRAPERSVSDERIQTLFRDSKGVLWLGTYDGLNAWDPVTSTWQTFRNDPSNPASITGNSVNSIEEDREGVLWIGTRDGLNAYNRGTGTFRRYVHDPSNPGSLPENYISAIHVDSEGNVWVGTLNGMLCRFDRASKTFRSHSLALTRTFSILSDDMITTISEDEGGRLWVGLRGNGVTILSRRNPLLRQTVMVEPGNAQSLSSNGIMAIMRDAEGVMWIGTGGGVNTVYSKVRRFEPISASGRLNDANSGGVTCFTEGSGGIIRVGLFGGGVHNYDPASGALSPLPRPSGETMSSDVQTLLTSRDGLLWIGTYEGLHAIDPSTNTVRTFRHNPADPASISSNSISSLHEDRDGAVWIGTDGNGLNRLDRATGTFTRFQNDPARPTSLASNLVRVVSEDRRGRIWVGTTDKGLSLLDRASGRFTTIPHPDADSASATDYQVSSICEDAAGLLWIGTNKGLCVLDGAMRMRSFGRRDGLASTIISGLLFGTDGNLWLSSSEGMARITISRDTRGGTVPNATDVRLADIVHFDVSDGLQGVSFNQGACFAASDGRLYFGGPGGFNAFHPSAIKVRPFIPNVVLTTFLLFNKRVTPGDKTGILTAPIEASDSITLSYDQNVLSFEFATLSYLSPERNQFKYWLEGFDREPNYVDANKRFATYTNLAPGEYELHVRGANSDGVWSSTEAVLHITITPPWWQTTWAYAGYALATLLLLYVFDRAQRRRVIRRERAAAQIREAEAQAEVAEARARTLQAENERKEIELVKARELEKAYAALDESLKSLRQTQDQLIHSEKMASLGALTAGIAHEIRNPLNFINNFSSFSSDIVRDMRTALTESPDRSIREIQSEILPDLDDLEVNVAKINEHGKRAESIVRGMLLHSRGKPGEMQPSDLNALVDETASLAFNSVKANGMTAPVRFERTLDPSIGIVSVVPQEFSRVLLNLLNNAFYAVNERHATGESGYEPVVTAATERIGDKVRITVRDNASGIPEELRARIFEPFYTTKPAGQGTGLGLSLSYDIIVKGHNGSLTVESTPGQGTAFIITLTIA